MALAGYSQVRPPVFGHHTPISIAREGGLWQKIPFLKDNGGMLPPFMIAVSDRRRVFSGVAPLADCVHLQKEVTRAQWGEDAVFKARIKHVVSELRAIREIISAHARPKSYGGEPGGDHEIASRMQGLLLRRWLQETGQLLLNVESVGTKGPRAGRFSADQIAASLDFLASEQGLCEDVLDETLSRISRRLESLADYLTADAGRVNLAIGVYMHDGLPLPVTILETQVGCPAQDVNLWEALVHSREDGYMLGNTEVPSRGLVAIRTGTGAGIAPAGCGEAGQVSAGPGIGDMVNATFVMGDASSVRQRLGALSSLDPNDREAFLKAWGEIGHFTADGRWPLLKSSPDVVLALGAACHEMGLACHDGGSFTKESRHIDSNSARLQELRISYGALSLEMEYFGHAFLANELSKAGIPVSCGMLTTIIGSVPGGTFAQPGSADEAKANETQARMMEAAMRALWKIAYGR
jgi:hypothetical protein